MHEREDSYSSGVRFQCGEREERFASAMLGYNITTANRGVRPVRCRRDLNLGRV
jgi:hypothetical protein